MHTVRSWERSDFKSILPEQLRRFAESLADGSEKNAREFPLEGQARAKAIENYRWGLLRMFGYLDEGEVERLELFRFLSPEEVAELRERRRKKERPWEFEEEDVTEKPSPEWKPYTSAG